MVILLSILKHSKAAGEKVLIFTNNLSTLNYLQYLLILRGFTFLRIDGSAANRRSRPDDIAAFSAGGHDAYIISIKAGGQGINLFTASRVVNLDAYFSPIWDAQPVGRAYRIGQQKDVFVYHFIAEGSVDTQLAKLKHLKHRLADVLVDKNWRERKAFIGEHDLKKLTDRPVLVQPKTFWKGEEFWGLDILVLDRVVGEKGSERALSDIHVLSEPVAMEKRRVEMRWCLWEP